MTTGNLVRPVALPTLPDIKAVSRVKFNWSQVQATNWISMQLISPKEKEFTESNLIKLSHQKQSRRSISITRVKKRWIIMRLQISKASLPKIIHQPTFQGEFYPFQVWKYKVLCHIWLQYASRSRYNYEFICLRARSSQIAHTNLLL